MLGMAAAIVGPMAAAVPFEVELTIPGANGYLFPSGYGVPGIPFEAPYIVVRAVGDTANVIYRSTIGAGSRYLALDVRIEIPDIGSGTLGSGMAVGVSTQGIDITSPAFFTVFDLGVRADVALPPEYDLQSSLGPVAANAFTYHWGPTSSMISFKLDSGVEGQIRASFPGAGGTLRITAGGNAPNPVAARVYTDLAAFVNATGPHRVATFEEGSGTASGGVTFPGDLLQVIESVIEASGTTVKTHANWFGTSGSPTHFAIDPVGSANQPTGLVDAAFAEPVLAAGFFYNCFECNENPLQYGFLWTTRDADGATIEQGTTVVDEPAPSGVLPARPGFFGLTTTKPFRRLTVERRHPFSGSPRWVYDDVRYATTLPAVEYHHAGFDHYFVTALADELTKLDNGTFTGWARTGLRFDVGAPGAAGTNPVCRLFSASFAPKSSHFYSSDAAECELRKADPHWQFEGTVFALGSTDASGGCAAGTTPLYRLYNNGQGGAPNHRYTTSLAARQAMVDAGWIPEGAGALGVIGCVTQ
jgi:hypothetical protein